MGIFFAIEGPDGSGKTTQAARLASRLRAGGYSVVGTREPSDGPAGRLIRQSLKGEVTLAADAMGPLFAADRIDHVRRVVAPAFDAGRVVVTDRFDLSNDVYRAAEADGPFYMCPGQRLVPCSDRADCSWTGEPGEAVGEGLQHSCPRCGRPLAWSDAVQARLRWTGGLDGGLQPAPDLTIVLSVPAEVAAARRRARGQKPERYEDDRMQARCCALYAAGDMLLAGRCNSLVINATGSEDEVAAQVWQAAEIFLALAEEAA